MEQLACKRVLTCLGCSNDVSSSMYDEQSINSIDKFRSLDDESVKTLCMVPCSHGGVMAADDPYPGVKVNERSVSNLIIAV